MLSWKFLMKIKNKFTIKNTIINFFIKSIFIYVVTEWKGKKLDLNSDHITPDQKGGSEAHKDSI